MQPRVFLRRVRFHERSSLGGKRHNGRVTRVCRNANGLDTAVNGVTLWLGTPSRGASAGWENVIVPFSRSVPRSTTEYEEGRFPPRTASLTYTRSRSPAICTPYVRHAFRPCLSHCLPHALPLSRSCLCTHTYARARAPRRLPLPSPLPGITSLAFVAQLASSLLPSSFRL